MNENIAIELARITIILERIAIAMEALLFRIAAEAEARER